MALTNWCTTKPAAPGDGRTGFTLIELSIVLVIIGLIAGGIFVGKDLIHTATLRSMISDIREIDLAVNAFRIKYNCIPGDCTHADNFFAGATNGDGDERINSGWWDGTQAYPMGNNNNTAESFQFWYQLQQAGLIRGTYTGVVGPGSFRNYIVGTNVMAARILSGVGYTVVYFDLDGPAPVPNSDFSPSILGQYTGNILFVGGQSPLATCCEPNEPVLNPIDAFYIDSKVDDGRPGQGKIISYLPAYFQINEAKVCVTDLDPAVAVYNTVAYTDIACSFLIRTGF